MLAVVVKAVVVLVVPPLPTDCQPPNGGIGVSAAG